jgi:hypothetical protein
MPPERKIEKLLRAYAKKRRADAGDSFSLHPVARQRLQEEVARQSREPEPEASVSVWELLRRQWAFFIGFALVVFLGAALILPVLTKAKLKASKAPTQMFAQNLPKTATTDNRFVSEKESPRRPDSTDAVSGKMESAPSPALTAPLAPPVLASGEVVPANAPGQADLDRDQMILQKQPDQKSLMDTASPALKQGIATVSPNSNTVLDGFATALPTNAALPAAPTINGVALAANNRLTTNAMAWSQNLSPHYLNLNNGGLNNAYQNTSTSPRSGVVLTRFQVIQNGKDIRFVDYDGSVYRGSWEPQTAEIQTDALSAQNQAQAAANGPNQAQNQNGANAQSTAQTYLVNVSGDNLTLKQKVTFTGGLSVMLNASSAGNYSLSNQNQHQPVVWLNSVIAGQATVAGTNHIEVNAVSVAP